MCPAQYECTAFEDASSSSKKSDVTHARLFYSLIENTERYLCGTYREGALYKVTSESAQITDSNSSLDAG